MLQLCECIYNYHGPKFSVEYLHFDGCGVTYQVTNYVESRATRMPVYALVTWTVLVSVPFFSILVAQFLCVLTD